MSRKEGAVEYMTEQNHHDRPSTVRSFLTDHAGEAFSMMTPCVFVELTAAQAEALLDGRVLSHIPALRGSRWSFPPMSCWSRPFILPI